MKLVITLSGASEIPPDERKHVEHRYREALEVVFGGSLAAWKRFEAAKAAQGLTTPQAARDRARWEEVAATAAKLSLGGLPYNTVNASFGVRLTE